MSDSELISNYKESEKETERKIIKANFILHNIKDENVILPVGFKKLKDLIQYEYSLNDPSININDFKIYYIDENSNKEIKNENDYDILLKYLSKLDLKKRIIYIEEIEDSKKDEDKNESQEEDEGKDEDEDYNENENEDVNKFSEYCEKIIKKEIKNLTINIESLLLNDEKCMKFKGDRYQLNHSVHNNCKCSECGKEHITGYLYKCSVEDNFLCCDKCVHSHDHPVFQIP
jgi:hypothetical protein